MSALLRQQLTASVALECPFQAEHGRVTWTTNAGPIVLDFDQVERLLDIWQEADCPASRRLFNSLYQAHMANGGVPRCCPANHSAQGA